MYNSGKKSDSQDLTEEASKMSPKVKELVTKADDLNSILGAHVVGETICGKLSSDLHTANK